jgi:hypothetical protein
MLKTAIVVNRINDDLDGKLTFLCPVCCEGEIEYQMQPPNVAISKREVVLAKH